MTLAKWEKESSESSQNDTSTMISALGSALGNSISHHVHFVTDFVHLMACGNFDGWNIGNSD